MADKFFASFATKHLVIGICCSIAGWGASQLYTIGIQQAAVIALQEEHQNKLAELSTLPPKMAVVEDNISVLINNDLTLATDLKEQEEAIWENSKKISILKAKQGDIDG